MYVALKNFLQQFKISSPLSDLRRQFEYMSNLTNVILYPSCSEHQELLMNFSGEQVVAMKINCYAKVHEK